MGFAIQSALEKGVGSTTLEFKITLERPITPQTGPIKAEDVFLNCCRRVGTAEGRITGGCSHTARRSA
jgi:acyl-coenzyme A thioesterase PaaI-like protein